MNGRALGTATALLNRGVTLTGDTVAVEPHGYGVFTLAEG